MLDDSAMADETVNPTTDEMTEATGGEEAVAAPAKEPERLMCTLENRDGQVIAKCAKPKLEAAAQSVEMVQDEMRKQAKEKGVETELGWKWV